MVQYSFKPGFVPHIRSGLKKQTIRLPRKRHARPGEDLQLYTGPRMRPVRIGLSVCQSVHDVRLDFAENAVTLDDAITIEGAQALDDFAIRDGFATPAASDITPWRYMSRWWALTHPDQPIFAGVLVDWGDTFRLPEALAA